MLMQYAWKGFWRRRTQALLSVLGITLSIGLLVAIVTITQSIERAVASSLDAAGADMVVQKRVKACPFSIIKLPRDLATIDADVVEKLRNYPGVEEASGVLELWAFHAQEPEAADTELTAESLGFPTQPPKSDQALSAGTQEGLPMIGGKALQPTVVAGIDPEKRTIGPVRIASRDEVGEDETCCAVTRGRYLVPNDHYHVMISEDYAQARRLRLGDKIPLGLEHEFEIIALLDVSGAARIAGAEAFIPLHTAQELLGRGDVVDTIFVSVQNTSVIKDAGDYARQLIGKNASITTESNVEAGTAALASVTRNSMLAISAFVLLFALLLLTRNALDTVARRVDEVGIMKAIGWKDSDVARLFVAEAAYSGLFGGIAGSALGSLAGWLYGQFADLQLPQSLNYFPPCSTTEAPLALPLSTNPSLPIFLLGLVLALAIGTLSGLAASRRAAKLDPADALHRL